MRLTNRMSIILFYDEVVDAVTHHSDVYHSLQNKKGANVLPNCLRLIW